MTKLLMQNSPRYLTWLETELDRVEALNESLREQLEKLKTRKPGTNLGGRPRKHPVTPTVANTATVAQAPLPQTNVVMPEANL